MRDSIAGYTDAVLEGLDAPTLGVIAGDLAGIGQLLGTNEDLMSVLSDPGVPAPSRRGVLTDLFGGRVDGRSLRLVNFAADTDRATEFPEDVEWLTTRAAAARDGLEAVGSGPLGRRTAGERMEGYTTAVLDTIEDKGTLGEIEDELFRFLRIVEGTPELRTALESREVPAPRRRRVVADLLGARATAATTRLAGYATGVGRPRDYLQLLEEVLDRVASESNRRVAEVRSFLPLEEDQRARLGAALKRLTGRDVDVRVTVDRRVLGGFVATVGDTVVDGSARHRLDLLKERLTLPEATLGTGDAESDNASPDTPGESA